MIELALLVATLMAVAAGSYLLTALTIRLVPSRLRAPAILMSGFILPLCLFVLAFGLFHTEHSEYPKSDAPIMVLSGTLIGALMATPISLTAAWAAVYRYKAQRQAGRE
jgi:hypothetical protein